MTQLQVQKRAHFICDATYFVVKPVRLVLHAVGVHALREFLVYSPLISIKFRLEYIYIGHLVGCGEVHKMYN